MKFRLNSQTLKNIVNIKKQFPHCTALCFVGCSCDTTWLEQQRRKQKGSLPSFLTVGSHLEPRMDITEETQEGDVVH